VPRETSGELAQFNGEYLAILQQAGRMFYGEKALVQVLHNGDSPALVHFGEQDAGKLFGVIMPYRASKVVPDHSWAFDASPIVSQVAA
jgi:hypothetical protein